MGRRRWGGTGRRKEGSQEGGRGRKGREKERGEGGKGRRKDGNSVLESENRKVVAVVFPRLWGEKRNGELVLKE